MHEKNPQWILNTNIYSLIYYSIYCAKASTITKRYGFTGQVNRSTSGSQCFQGLEGLPLLK